MQFSEDIEHTPFKSTSKKILTADLLAVRSVANNLGESGETIDFVVVYKAQIS